MKTNRSNPLRVLRLATAALLLASLSPMAVAQAPATEEAEPVAAPIVEAPRAAIGAEIEYDQLIYYVGARIRLHTKNSTVREGVLTGSSSIAFNLQVDNGHGGYLLGVPRETVAKVVLLAEPAAKP